MVKRAPDRLDATFSALADPTRRAILQRLAAGDASVGEVAEPFDISAPAISRHLRVLEEAGLVTRQKKGRVHVLRVQPEPLGEALEWIARNGRDWEERFDALDRLLAITREAER